MELYELSTNGDVKALGELPAGVVLSCAFGCFDGVHIGHAALLAAAISDAQLLDAQIRDAHGTTAAAACGAGTMAPAVWTFSEPVSKPWIIPIRERLSLCGRSGIRYALCERFEDVRALSPSDFIRRLVFEHRLRHAVCGYDFRFGRERIGDASALRDELVAALSALRVCDTSALCTDAMLELPVTVVEKVSVGGEAVSSTRIRRAISEGEVETARILLGRPYTLTGEILPGRQLGRTFSRPTANLRYSEHRLVPKRGVYYTVCRVDGNAYRSVTNIGYRPTVNGDTSDITCEAHLLDFDRAIYGKTVELAFLHFVRPETEFSDTHALAEQIGRDVRGAEAFFDLPESAELLR